MPHLRSRVRTLLLALPAIAVLAAFFRPEAHKDPMLLSVLYGTLITVGLVRLLIYAVSLLDFSGPVPKEAESATKPSIAHSGSSNNSADNPSN